MAGFLKFIHTKLGLRGREIDSVYVKHGISQFDVDDVNAEIEKMGRIPGYNPSMPISEMMRIGAAFQKVQCELQERGLSDVEPARARSR